MKILIFCLPGIGDALMATPMIRILKKELPKAKIDIATMFTEVAYLFKNNSAVESTHYLPLYKTNKLSGLKSILALRKKTYDISILAFPAYRREYHIVQMVAGAKKRFAHRFKKGFFSELHFLNTDFIAVEENKHNVINNLNMLRLLGIDWEKKYKKDNFRYELVLDKKDITFGEKYLVKLGWDKKDVVGIHPGSINSPAGIFKRWPIDRFTKVAKHLIKKKKKILIFFGPFEVELGKKLFVLINDPKNCRLIENTTFNESLGILNSIRLLITNDNGFAHLANALNVRTITLFGPTNIDWCAPYNSTITVNIRKATFLPWFRNDMKVTSPPKDVMSGMEAIKVNDVIGKLEEV